jgi:alanyl-tRNA synthetase
MNTNQLTKPTGKDIRQGFIDFFIEKAGHTFVRSSPLVPGGDSTLLFTNAGMVQFKDVFLGTEIPPYTRAVNAQKCLRVAGKHNDLEDVGRDDSHHTFFEMLGNWSFGDYYQKEAIAWAWELLTEVWRIPKERLCATVFEDDQGTIPTDQEAAHFWLQQPGFNPEHLFFIGRKDNFWEMAETGPCGPCSEIHFDLRPEDGPFTREDIDTDRFVELWNLVFIQYNRTGPDTLEPLPKVHIDTGMGFERIVNVLQNAGSNYKTDLFWPLITATARLAGHNNQQIEANFTPYRVIADHARAAAFLIADGVVPGNIGRNYITRMIIRRAYRFGGKIGLNQPFLSGIAETVIENYGEAYPELLQHQAAILETIRREEEQFQRTLDKATANLESLLDQIEAQGFDTLSGEQAAYLYTTYGMPFEISRDIANERGLFVDEAGFNRSMETHRLASGAGKAIGTMGDDNVKVYQAIRERLQEGGKLGPAGVTYQPYRQAYELSFPGQILALVKDAQEVDSAAPSDQVEVILPATSFYLESGGQVTDTGVITGDGWEIEVSQIRKPAAGMITHLGTVRRGNPKVGDPVLATVDQQRREDIMRNHTATHLLHAALHTVLGSHARQAGSLVAPDRLRFDFTHPEALSREEILEIESIVNQQILANTPLDISHKSLTEALEGGAIALFGEKYEDEVRNIIIGDQTVFSNELCGGTHVTRTGEIGTFIITSEGSAAAGIRRIEAVTGRQAYKLIQSRFQILDRVAEVLTTSPEQVLEKIETTLSNLKEIRTQVEQLRQNLALVEFSRVLDETQQVSGIDILTAELNNTDADTLRQLADRFRQRHPQNGIAVLASVVSERPILIAAVTQDLVPRGIRAGDLAGFIARQLGGGGGGKPTLAQAGGKDAAGLEGALKSVPAWVEENLTQ